MELILIFYLVQNIQSIIISTLVNKKNDNDILYTLFILRLQNPVHILRLQHISVRLATFQALNSHIQLVPAILDKLDINNILEVIFSNCSKSVLGFDFYGMLLSHILLTFLL